MCTCNLHVNYTHENLFCLRLLDNDIFWLIWGLTIQHFDFNLVEKIFLNLFTSFLLNVV